MKILYISPIYFENADHIKNIHILGGGGRYPFELAKNVLRIGKDEVEIIFFGKKKANFSIDGVNISVIPAIKLFPKINGYANPLPLSLDFYKKIKEADIVHGIQIRTEAVMLATLYSKIIRKHIFVTDNGFGGISLAMLFPFELLTTGVMAISKNDSKYWMSKNKFIIYGGVDTEKFSYYKTKKKYVLYVGRFLPHKGIDVLVKAMPKEYKLIVAGNPLDSNYLLYLKNKSNSKNIIFIDKPNDKELIELYQNASCLVLPSTNRTYDNKTVKKPELFGLVVAEAMACGTPVIVSNVGSLPEFVENNKNGFVFSDRNIYDLRNKITRLIQEKELRLSMGKKCRDLAEKKYSWKTIARNVRNNYVRSK